MNHPLSSREEKAMSAHTPGPWYELVRFYENEWGFACEVCDVWTFGLGEMPQYPDAECEACGHIQERPLTEHLA